MNPIAWLGLRTRERWRNARFIFATALAILVQAARRRNWPRTVRSVFVRQMLFTGIDAGRFIATLAVLVGLTVVLQTHVWLTRVGQSALFGPVLVAVLIREAGPLLVNFIVIGRTGTAIAAEMSVMQVTDEVGVLETQGVDPFLYLVMPRGLAVALSVFCLSIIFVLVAIVSGYVGGLLLGVSVGTPDLFFTSVLQALRPEDVLNLIAKTLLPGLLTGAICCEEGLRSKGALTEVPQSASRGVVRSVAALFFVSVLVSILTYA